MYKYLLIFLLFSSELLATEFKLREYEYYGAAPGLELSLYPEGASTLDEIFNVLNVHSHRKLYVRLIGESSEKTNSELFNYYNDRFPYWRGNLKEEPQMVKKLFIDALKTTTLYKELASKLGEHYYKLDNISFEKLYFTSNTISIPDVYLQFKYLPNEAIEK